MNKYIIKLLLFFNKIIDIIIMFIILTILSISIYALYDSYQIYDSTKINDEFEIINDENPMLKIDNKNIIGWINIIDTQINYPIVQGNDNIEYLSKNYKKEYSYSGSIFLDYRNNSDFSDNYSILYGHSFIKGGMFSDIKKYIDLDYFNNHLNGKLYLKNKSFDLNIIMISRIKYNDEIYNLSITDKNTLIKRMLEKSINKISIINKNNKLLILSTCSSTSKDDRLIIVSLLK